MFRLFLLIHFYDKSNSCFFATRETNISECLHCPPLFYRKKKRIILVFQNKSLLLQHPRGEILGSRMRFLLLPVHRNLENFNNRGWKQCNAHSVCISRVQPSLYLTRYIRQRGVFVSQFISITVFQSQMYDEHDKSLRFSCIR